MKKTLLVLQCIFIAHIGIALEPTTGELISSFERAKQAYEAQKTDLDLCEKAAIASFSLVRADQLKYIEQSIELFNNALKLSNQARFRSYLGSCLLIKAREAKATIDKVELVQKGLVELDLGVAMAPNNVFGVYIRVESTINLPDFFNRLDQVTKDLDFLLQIYERNPGEIEKIMKASRLFELKASELELRKKPVAASTYRKKAKELP